MQPNETFVFASFEDSLRIIWQKPASVRACSHLIWEQVLFLEASGNEKYHTRMLQLCSNVRTDSGKKIMCPDNTDQTHRAPWFYFAKKRRFWFEGNAGSWKRRGVTGGRALI